MPALFRFVFLRAACTIAILGLSAPAYGQSQGVVVGDGAVIWRADVSVVAASPKPGTILELTARSDRWYEVVIPASLGGRGERGLIARSRITLLAGSEEPPLRPLRGSSALPPQARSAPARAMAARRASGWVAVNGGYQATSNGFVDRATFQANAEQADFSTDYTVKGGPTLDVGGGLSLGRSFGFGAVVTRFSRATPVNVSGRIPHPFFFSRLRPIGGEVSSLKREELALHVQARALFPVGNRLQATAFGGPTFFRVEQGIVTGISYSDRYPYDEATFSTAQNTPARESKLGINAGADVAFYFTRQLGVGFSGLYAGTRVDLPSAAGSTQQVKVGGLQLGAGLRLRF